MSYVRAECENGHGQDIRFGRPPDDAPGVGGIAVHIPLIEHIDRVRISSKAGTHPIYIDNETTDPELYCELVGLAGTPCGICGGCVSYEVVG